MVVADNILLHHPIVIVTRDNVLELRRLKQWESVWDLSFHPSKISVVSSVSLTSAKHSNNNVCASRPYSPTRYIYISIKHLRVTLQNDLKLDQPALLANTVSNANKTLKIGYKSPVPPLLEY